MWESRCKAIRSIGSTFSKNIHSWGGFLYPNRGFTLRTKSVRCRESLGATSETVDSDKCGQYKYYRTIERKSEVKGEVRTTYGNEDAMERNDEHKDNDGNVRKEAPNDPDIRTQQPIGLDSSIVRRLGHLHLAPNAPIHEDEQEEHGMDDKIYFVSIQL